MNLLQGLGQKAKPFSLVGNVGGTEGDQRRVLGKPKRFSGSVAVERTKLLQV